MSHRPNSHKAFPFSWIEYDVCKEDGDDNVVTVGTIVAPVVVVVVVAAVAVVVVVVDDDESEDDDDDTDIDDEEALVLFLTSLTYWSSCVFIPLSKTFIVWR